MAATDFLKGRLIAMPADAGIDSQLLNSGVTALWVLVHTVRCEFNKGSCDLGPAVCVGCRVLKTLEAMKEQQSA